MKSFIHFYYNYTAMCQYKTYIEYTIFTDPLFNFFVSHRSEAQQVDYLPRSYDTITQKHKFK